MSPEERQLLQDLFDRLRDAAREYRDPDADELIARELRYQPHAPYFLAQAVIVQQGALEEANARIRDLEDQVRDLSDGGDRRRGASGGGFLGGGRGGSPFGGSRSSGTSVPSSRPREIQQEPSGGPWMSPGAPRGNPLPGPGMPAPPVPPAPPAPPQQASSGGGFLRNAITTAAVVAGGAILYDQLKGMFGGDSSAQAGQSGGDHGPFGSEQNTGLPGPDMSQNASFNDDPMHDFSDSGGDDSLDI